jgi:hypothetical protein
VGYVGVEHLVLALLDGPPDPRFARVRYQLRSGAAQAEAYLAALEPADDRAPDWSGTERLRRIGARLAEGFDTTDLWSAIVAEAQVVLRLLFALGPGAFTTTDDDDATARSRSEHFAVADGPVTALEIVGGPEDGRVLRPAPGERIGRRASVDRAEHVLYAASALVDRRLSRAHLAWLGDGRLRSLAPVHRVVGAEHPAMPGDVLALSRGDAVAPSPGTWLVGTGG